MSEKNCWKTTIIDSSVSKPHTFIAAMYPEVIATGQLTMVEWPFESHIVLRSENIVSLLTVRCEKDDIPYA